MSENDLIESGSYYSINKETLLVHCCKAPCGQKSETLVRSGKTCIRGKNCDQLGPFPIFPLEMAINLSKKQENARSFIWMLSLHFFRHYFWTVVTSTQIVGKGCG